MLCSHGLASVVVSSWLRRVCLIRWNSSLPISPLAYRFSAISNAVSGVRPSIQYAHGGLNPSRVKNSRQAIAMTIIIAIHSIGNMRMPRIREWLVVMSAISGSGCLISQSRAWRSHVKGEVHTSLPNGMTQHLLNFHLRSGSVVDLLFPFLEVAA